MSGIIKNWNKYTGPLQKYEEYTTLGRAFKGVLEVYLESLWCYG